MYMCVCVCVCWGAGGGGSHMIVITFHTAEPFPPPHPPTQPCFSSYSVSAPTVTITRTPERLLYPGDGINLTCTVDVGGVVDTPVMVAVDITGPGGLMSSGSESLMVTETTYQRTVTLTFLSDSSSGDYTCNTTVSPDPSPGFVTGDGQNSNMTTISLGNKVFCYHLRTLQNNMTSPSLPLVKQLLGRNTTSPAVSMCLLGHHPSNGSITVVVRSPMEGTLLWAVRRHQAPL